MKGIAPADHPALHSVHFVLGGKKEPPGNIIRYCLYDMSYDFRSEEFHLRLNGLMTNKTLH